MRLFRALTAATCAVVLAVGCRDVLGIRDFDAGDAATDAPIDAACEASIDPDSGLLDDVVQLALGNGFSCALQSTGTVLCWGQNDQGQLGPNVGGFSFTPVTVTTNAIRISAGNDFVCAVTVDQSDRDHVQCWGNNDVLQLGRTSDAAIADIEGVGTLPFKALSASHEHACALGEGFLYCWGANDFLQSGKATLTEAGVVPQTILVQTDTTGVATGQRHTCFLQNQTISCFGVDDTAQFGSPPNATPTTNIASVTLDAGILDLQANATDTCALLDSGRVACSGSNAANQIATVVDASSFIPVAIFDTDSGAPLTFASFAIADEHSCFVTTNGNVVCTGAQQYGQLGNGTIIDASSQYANFVEVDDAGTHLDGVIGVAVTGVVPTGSQGFSMKQQFHSCAIVRTGCGASGRVMCWGANGHGQLGTGSDGGPSPVPVWVVAP